MGYLRRPNYYKNFKCISSKCTDSCCQEWEIDIDDETLQFYMQVEGEFGDRLRKNIKVPSGRSDIEWKSEKLKREELEDEDSEEIETAHFIQTKDERCPFLNNCGLCDIFIHLGEEHLSQICTHHPRFYDWFLKGEEAGLGLCCEEAARLILQKSGYPKFEFIEDDEIDTNNIANPEDEDLLFQKEIEQMLFDMRDQLFGIIKPEIDMNQDEKMQKLYEAAVRFQDEYDDVMFPICDDDLKSEEGNGGKNAVSMKAPKWSAQFWNQEFLESLTEFYLTLEINDENWWKLLCDIRKNLPEILNRRNEFLKYYENNLFEYEQLMIYFIYRHFMKARNDDALFEKIVFALISTNFIQILNIYEWMLNGRITQKTQINICKLYSKEIEYDEENMEQVSLYMSSN